MTTCALASVRASVSAAARRRRRRRTADVALDDGHAVGGERAGLVGADGRRVAHRLARVQVTHQVVVQHHFLQAIVKYTVIQTGHLDVERISAQQGQNGGGGGGISAAGSESQQ